MNTCIFTGRLTADPEVRNNNGNVVATFNLAIDRPKKDANGNWTHEADYARCILFGKRAEWFGNNARKGYEVFVDASFKSGSYTKQSGEKVYTNDFWCSDVKIIGVPKNEGNFQNNAQQTQAPPVQNANAIPNGVNNNLPWNNGQQAPAQTAQPTPAPAPTPAPQTTQPSAATPNMQPTYSDPYGGFVDNGFAPYS